MSATKSNQTGGSTDTGSTKSFVTAVVTALIIFGAEMLLFVWFHARQKKVFQPRTFLVPEDKRPRELPKNPLKWFMTIYKTPTDEVLRINGLDAYALVRLLSMFVKIFVVFWLLTWVVLMPVTAVKPNNGLTGLAQFSFGNVGVNQQARYGAHLAVAWVLTAWVLFLIWKESSNFVAKRHEYLSGAEWARSERARTVLVTGVKKDLMDVEQFTDFAGRDNVERVWLVRDVADVNDVFDERQKECTKLEGAEGKLLKLACKRIRKSKATAPNVRSADTEQGQQGAVNSVVPEKKRPSRRLGKIPFIGKKVDSINYGTDRVHELNTQLDEMRANPDKYDLATSVIVRFATVASALEFSLHLDKQRAKRISKAYPDIAPANIFWNNLGKNSAVIPGLKAVSWALTIGLILIFAPIVAFVGTVSNLSSLCASVSFLSWLCKLPPVVVGIIQGALPPLLLAIVFMLVPIIFRQLAARSGLPLESAIDISAFKRYFLFLIIHGFLIVTIAGSLTSALPAVIKDPGNAPSLLAEQLPLSSTFFCTYLIITGLAASGKFLSQAISVVKLYIMRFLGGATPRKIFKVEYNMESASANYFTIIPNITLLVVLGIVYSVIQPIVTILAFAAMVLYYLSFVYLYVWVYDEPIPRDSGGKWFGLALTHVFVGLYIEELCLIGLFFLASNAQGNRSAIPEGALMIVLLIITVAFHLYVKRKMHLKTVEMARMNGDIFTSRTNASDDTLTHQPTVDVQVAGRTSENAFDMPSMWQPQPVIWIADDLYSLGRIEASKINAAGVQASTEGTSMDEKGKVEVHAAAPDDPRADHLNPILQKEKH